MLGGLVAVLIAQSCDAALLLGAAISRVASVGFLRLATLVLAQGLDLATFNLMVTRHGVAAEANPLVNDLFETMGMPGVAFAKLALVLLVGALTVAAAAHARRGTWGIAGGLPLALAIAAGLIGGITNAAVILG